MDINPRLSTRFLDINVVDFPLSLSLGVTDHLASSPAHQPLASQSASQPASSGLTSHALRLVVGCHP